MRYPDQGLGEGYQPNNTHEKIIRFWLAESSAVQV